MKPMRRLNGTIERDGVLVPWRFGALRSAGEHRNFARFVNRPRGVACVICVFFLRELKYVCSLLLFFILVELWYAGARNVVELPGFPHCILIPWRLPVYCWIGMILCTRPEEGSTPVHYGVANDQKGQSLDVNYDMRSIYVVQLL